MTSRRTFLSGLGAAALTPAFGAAAETRKLRLGFQVYGVRDLCAKDFAGTLKAARALGYEGVETGRFYGLDGAGLKRVCADAGLKLLALQLYPHTLVGAELAKTISLCHACGADRINVAWFKGSAENVNDWRLLAGVLTAAAPALAREGIALGYHNHAQEFEIRFDGRPVIDLLAKQFDPAVTFEPDPGWCRLAGGDPVDFMRRFAGRYRMLHVMPAIPGVTDGAPADYPLGPGACGVGSERDLADWRQILAAAREGGAEWLVVKPTAHPGAIDDLRASFASLGDLV